MTDNAAADPSAKASAQPSSQQSAYGSLAALRDGHLALKQSISDATQRPEFAEMAKSVRAFLAEAQKTGAFLDDAKERRAAQGILDYWSAELASYPDAPAEDFVPVLLAPADAAQVARGDDEPVQSKEDQRALIRLAATARQWRDSGEKSGYLLVGETIKEAARFKDQDPALAEFVEASLDAVKAKQMFWLTLGAVVLAVAAVCWGTFSYWQFKLLPDWKNQYISALQEQSGPDKQIPILKWLDARQPWLPPYDISGTPKIADVTLPGFRMYAPNFSGVEFSRVRFPVEESYCLWGATACFFKNSYCFWNDTFCLTRHRNDATLPAATFNSTSFSFDDNGKTGDNDFNGAGLRLAQFRNAKIAFTSFAGADLYRAVFDRAQLCDVDFSGANLRLASFWGVTSNEQTKEHLKNAAWWLAVGWPWSDIEKLAHEGKARSDVLKQSLGFQHDIGDATQSLSRSSPGSLDYALALSDMAFTYAIWGIDLTRPGYTSDPCAAQGVPENGRQAAEQAVCIVRKLNSEGEKKGTYKDLLSNVRDTLAYLIMESGDIAAALKVFAELAADDPKYLDATKDTSFRYAIAQYAGGGDKVAAIARFKAAIEKMRYQPTHELQNLRAYIFDVPEFVAVLKTATNTLWPPVPNDTECPGATSAAAK
jgi:hypothetical protein